MVKLRGSAKVTYATIEERESAKRRSFAKQDGSRGVHVHLSKGVISGQTVRRGHARFATPKSDLVPFAGSAG